MITFTNNLIVICNRSTPQGLHYQATVLGLHFYDSAFFDNMNFQITLFSKMMPNFAGMPMVADGRGVGVKNRENLPTS